MVKMHLAVFCVESGVITLTSFISPYRADREKVRARMAPGTFDAGCSFVLRQCSEFKRGKLVAAAGNQEVFNVICLPS